MRIAKLVVDVRIRQLEAGLKLIAGDKCKSFVAPFGCAEARDLTPYAPRWKDRWCDACIARAPLEGRLPAPVHDIEVSGTRLVSTAPALSCTGGDRG